MDKNFFLKGLFAVLLLSGCSGGGGGNSAPNVNPGEATPGVLPVEVQPENPVDGDSSGDDEGSDQESSEPPSDSETSPGEGDDGGETEGEKPKGVRTKYALAIGAGGILESSLPLNSRIDLPNTIHGNSFKNAMMTICSGNQYCSYLTQGQGYKNTGNHLLKKSKSCGDSLQITSGYVSIALITSDDDAEFSVDLDVYSHQ